MSFIQDTSIFELKSSLQLSSFVELLLEPINKTKHIYLIKLGLHEALVNAVKHGNNLDPSKIIKVKRIITTNWCVWQIQDQGKGMAHKKRVFKLPKNVDSTNGRGLFIIHECFDDVRWSPKGNRLQLALKR
ncbi:MAG: anti-sigma regulatory factor [Prochlorococcus sp. SP3034]|nr:anti-sigma regulatory factor [Prochlorococcus sp. SP3034]|tara:strand:- start:435 stop:827 length:393 start_codon:yes stop_codon:yes gene_type:complete